MLSRSLNAENNLTNFIENVRAMISVETIDFSQDQIKKYSYNTTAYIRTISAIVYAKSTQDIQIIIELANFFKVPLYPVSQGKNWGMGSKLPVCDNCVILDLSSMNHILEVNTEFGYAVIEPGVTQQQLTTYLADNSVPYFLDVTGSGQETSIMGNTLERGTAYNSMRSESYLNMEVVLGTGEIIAMGYNHYQNAQAKNLYKYGIGPDLSGLFFQSNFGIVTKLTIKLYPIGECRQAFLFTLKKEEDIGEFVQAIKKLKSYNIFQSIVHIGNKRRSEITLAPLLTNFCKDNNINYSEEELQILLNKELKGCWSAIGSLIGTKKQVTAAKYELKKHLAKIGRPRFFAVDRIEKIIYFLRLLRCKKKFVFLSAVKPLLELTIGKTTNAALHSTVWPNREKLKNNNPDLSQSGIIFCLPILPMRAVSITEAITIIQKVTQGYNFIPALTLNLLDDRAIEVVISINFDRNNTAEIKSAHLCIAQLNAALIDAGYYPYRIDINNMQQIYQNDSYWRTVINLKKLFDPNDIIAPGRYIPKLNYSLLEV